jgi:hypothetical protein
VLATPLISLAYFKEVYIAYRPLLLLCRSVFTAKA